MKKTYLVLGGVDDELSLPANGIKVGVDYGAFRLASLGQKFDYAIGDFDSVTPNELLEIAHYARQMIFLPHQKDVTDTEAAVEYLTNRGFDMFEIHDALGGRIDHTIANIRLMQRLSQRSLKIVLYGKKQKLTVLSPGVHTLRREQWPFKYVSFFACTEEVKSLTISNLLYEVEGQDLKREDIYAISNEWVEGKIARLSFDEGNLLVINDEDEGGESR